MKFTRYASGLRHARIAIASAVVLASHAPAGDWPMFAGDVSRSGDAVGAPATIQVQRWVAQTNADEEFVFAATPVAALGRVFANTRVFSDSIHSANRIIAFHATTGQRLWHADTPPDTLDSWVSPAIDERNGTVILATGSSVRAMHVSDGSTAWSASLPQQAVNASPLVTTDQSSGGVPTNRAILTTYSPFSTAYVVAINVDTFDASHNPFQPGEIAWAVPAFRLSGNTPAYADGIVYCTSVAGSIHAVDAASGVSMWSRSIGAFTFFGGLTIRDGHVYAASYNVSGGQNNSRLVKVRLSDQAIVWITPCERTDATPVVLPDGRIYLAGGIAGFGSARKLQAFQDHGTSVSLEWDTWQVSGGAWTVGGWTSQPLHSNGRLYVGAPAGASDPWGPHVALFTLDLSRHPAESGFIQSQNSGAGGSCSVWNGWLYSIGADGLHAFCDRHFPPLSPQPGVWGAQHIATEGRPWRD